MSSLEEKLWSVEKSYSDFVNVIKGLLADEPEDAKKVEHFIDTHPGINSGDVIQYMRTL